MYKCIIIIFINFVISPFISFFTSPEICQNSRPCQPCSIKNETDSDNIEPDDDNNNNNKNNFNTN